MRCPDCRREMMALFTSFACDYCDGLRQPPYYRGYIVYSGPEDLNGRPVHVFRTRSDAALWRAASNLSHCEIRQVLTEHKIRWQRSTGSLEQLELAERPFQLYEDHRYVPKPYRAFLAPQRNHDSSPELT